MERNPIRYGVYGALIITIATLLLYFINAEYVFSIAPYVTWAVFFGFMYKAAIDDRTDNRGFITFKEAFTSAFVVFAIASLAYPITYYLLENFLAPELFQIKLNMSIEGTVQVLEAIGQSESEIDKAVELIEAGVTVQDLPQTVMVYLAGFLFFWFIPMLIIAAIVKKEGNPNIGIDDTEHFVQS